MAYLLGALFAGLIIFGLMYTEPDCPPGYAPVMTQINGWKCLAAAPPLRPHPAERR